MSLQQDPFASVHVDNNHTPSVELASAIRLSPRHATPTDVASVRLVAVTKSTITISMRGQSIKLLRQDVLALRDLLESTL